MFRNIPVEMDSDDGTQLGGVLVVGAGDSGILYEYKEKVFGGGYSAVPEVFVSFVLVVESWTFWKIC